MFHAAAGAMALLTMLRVFTWWPSPGLYPIGHTPADVVRVDRRAGAAHPCPNARIRVVPWGEPDVVRSARPLPASTPTAPRHVLECPRDFLSVAVVKAADERALRRAWMQYPLIVVGPALVAYLAVWGGLTALGRTVLWVRDGFREDRAS